MHRVLQVHQAVPKQCTHMQTNTQHPWNTNRGGGGGQQRGWNHSRLHWSCSALYVACPPEHTTQGPVGRGGILPKNNTKDSQAPPLDNTIAPWFDDPSRRERNWFFFFFLHTACITRQRFDPVECGRLGSFKNAAIDKTLVSYFL